MQPPDIRSSDRWVIAGLVLFILLEIAFGAAWIRIDATPPYWDEAWYMYQGVRQLDALRSGGLPDWYGAWTGTDRTRPPLVPALTMPFFAILGPGGDAGLAINLVALVVLLAAVYALGAAIDSPRCGLLAALLVGSYPVVLGLVHILLVEMVMVALVAATLLALFKSDGFRNRRWTLLSGLLIGLGLLTKVFYVAFVAGPWLVTAWRGLRRGERNRRLAWLSGVLLSLLVAVLLAASWYAPNLGIVWERTVSAGLGSEGAPYGPANPLAIASLTGYLVRFAGSSMSLASFLLMLLGTAGLVRAMFRPKTQRKAGDRPASHTLVFLASSVLIGYAIFTSITNQDLKHSSGVLPAVALWTAWGLSFLFARRWKIATAGVAAVSIFLIVAGTVPGPLANHELRVRVLNSQLFLFHPAQPYLADTRYALPDPAPGPLAGIVTYAVEAGKEVAPPARPVRIGVIPDSPLLETWAVLFEVARRGVEAEVTPALPSNLAAQDVLIHKTGDWGWLANTRRISRMVDTINRADSGWFRLPQAFLLADGSQALIFAHVQSPFFSGVPAPLFPASVEFGAAARFLGADVRPKVSGGRVIGLDLTYYWMGLARTQVDYTVFVHLLDAETGEILAQDDHLLFAGSCPTSLWPPGRALFDTSSIDLPAGFAGSALTLRVGLYHGTDRLPVSSPEYNASRGDTFVDVGPVRLED